MGYSMHGGYLCLIGVLRLKVRLKLLSSVLGVGLEFVRMTLLVLVVVFV